jgi:hypothetical protein
MNYLQKGLGPTDGWSFRDLACFSFGPVHLILNRLQQVEAEPQP